MIAPATANIIGKMANGIADDILTTVILASKVPIYIAPAMNVNMYNNPIVKENIKKLHSLGAYIIEPETGRLACGDEGQGRLANTHQIVEIIKSHFEQKKDLTGKTVLITAGPTQEPIDPVRFISNHSTGKMGYAIAEAAYKRGAKVILISGPTNLSPTPDIKLIKVQTAKEMYDAVLHYLPETDIIFKAAAVADFCPKSISKEKIKKIDSSNILQLERTEDILEHIKEIKKPNTIVIGFAMETENAIENAKKKLYKKGLDLIVLNNLHQEGAGFSVDTNIVTLIYKDNKIEELPKMSKKELGNVLIDKLMELIKK